MQPAPHTPHIQTLSPPPHTASSLVPPKRNHPYPCNTKQASDVKSGGKHFANAAGWFKKARAAAEAADAERKAEQEKRAGAAKEEGGAAAEGASSEESKQQEGGEGEAAAAAAANGGQQDALTTLSSHAQVCIVCV